MYPPSNGSLLPRADIGTGALAGALVAILMAITSGNHDLAVYGPAATVVLQFAISYLLPDFKVQANALAGAVVVVTIGVYSLVAGLPFDAGSLQTALVFLVTFALTALLPPRQP